MLTLLLKRIVKTRVKMTIIASGFNNDQRNPRTLFLYRSLKSFFARASIKGAYRGILLRFFYGLLRVHLEKLAHSRWRLKE